MGGSKEGKPKARPRARADLRHGSGAAWREGVGGHSASDLDAVEEVVFLVRLVHWV